MTHPPQKHRRRSIRLPGYDYAQPGAYFITVCTHNRACLFGEVVDGEMRLNDLGHIVKRCWLEIPTHFPHATLDAYVVMPNHVHGIIIITDHAGVGVGARNLSPLPSPSPPRSPSGATPFRTPSRTIGSMIRGFKIGVTKWARQHADIRTVWQRNYYEHIIRDDSSLHRIRTYIAHNPSRWGQDHENPMRTDQKGPPQYP